MANPFGRTTGTKNRPGHNAGKRKGAGRPAKLNDDEKRSKAASDEKKRMAFLQQQEENKKKKDAERARNEETRQARLTQMHAKCVDALRRFGLAADKGDCDGDAEGGDDDGVNADDQADDYMCSDADVEKQKIVISNQEGNIVRDPRTFHQGTLCYGKRWRCSRKL